MLDHDTDSYQKISHVFVDKEPTGNLTRDHVLDNITTYWLTGTGASAARSYWESGQLQAQSAGQAPPPVTIPVGFSQFPDEIFRAPRAGPSRRTRPSATSTKRPGAATSPPGKSRRSSPRRCGPCSPRCDSAQRSRSGDDAVGAQRRRLRRPSSRVRLAAPRSVCSPTHGTRVSGPSATRDILIGLPGMSTEPSTPSVAASRRACCAWPGAGPRRLRRLRTPARRRCPRPTTRRTPRRFVSVDAHDSIAGRRSDSRWSSQPGPFREPRDRTPLRPSDQIGERERTGARAPSA